MVWMRPRSGLDGRGVRLPGRRNEEEVLMEHDSGDSTLRRQVLDVIVDVLASTVTYPDARASLLQHLEDNPGNPEMGLLAHLSALDKADHAACPLKDWRQQDGDEATVI